MKLFLVIELFSFVSYEHVYYINWVNVAHILLNIYIV